jgi:tellurite resistance protein TerA
MTETISLSKGKSVSLAKRETFGDVSVNLNWSQGTKPQPKGGLMSLFGRRPATQASSVDLDLGCLYELADGTKGCVQALGGNFGSFRAAPFVELSGDDRSGTNADGETMRINGARWKDVRRIAFYTFIYDGVADWAGTDAVVTVQVPGEKPIRLELGAYDGDERMCAICLIENERGLMKVKSLVQHHAGHRALDASLGWNLSWKVGTKD